MRYWVLCVLSGYVWALLAWLLANKHMGMIVWGGMAVAPLIAIAAGYLYRPFYGARAWVRVLMALASLYMTTLLFGLAMGAYDALFRAAAHRDSGEVVVEAILASLWGVTFTGYVIFLWPLAYWNHALVGRASGLD
jgi:hypothetical protein